MTPSELYKDIPIGVCILRMAGKMAEILYANPAGQLLANAIEDGQCGDLVLSLQSIAPPREQTLKLEHHAQPRWIKVTIGRGDFDGERVFLLWATDISASKESEYRLEKAVHEADAAAEMKANFLATMSHEIRTPMQSVYGLLELVAEEKPPEHILSMVNTARKSSSALLEILDDILDLAKMDADKMELDVFEVPVRTLVRGIIEALAVKIHGKKVVLLDDIEEDVPFVVIGDPKRLRQILMNFMSNAIKFTHEGTVTVRVTNAVQSITLEPGQAGLRFEVADTGIGMSAEAVSRLFKPFTQADSSTSRRYGGTGLGLSICKKLAELMGGAIGAYSETEKGSVFWFEIPAEEVSTQANTLDLPSLEGLSVLSVEDHPQGAKEIRRSLESMGAIVDSVPTAGEGLELVRHKPYDVGVIDQGLPDGLGLDLIREIMTERPFMGLVMYTVRDDAGLSHSLQSLGVTYLTKPASRAGLGAAVRAAAQAVIKMDMSGPKKLLIAEDTESVREVLQRQLDRLGVEADFVEDGNQALKAVETGQYGILFTDLHMPGIDGYEVVRRIREQEKDGERHYPVIVLTADVNMAQRQVYITHGFDECLLKPVTLGQFRRLLIRWGLLTEEAGGDISDTDNMQEPSEKHEGKAIDIKGLAAMMGGSEQDALEMISLFAEMTEPHIDAIRSACERGDAHTLHEEAHSLKGAARSACAARLGDLAGDLQENAAHGKIPDSLVEDILEEFSKIRSEINARKP
jgi:signal transduction histidine kinase/CheY-like chemotaxis protein